MAEERYVIFDCDIGNDDAWALMMLLKAEEVFKKFKTLAITCVVGNSDVINVTKNTIRVLDTLDRTDIPVYKGCASAILSTKHNNFECFHGEDGLGDVKHSYEVDMNRVEKTHAVNAMYKLACRHPKKVSFVLLGPLTNFAMCINMYEDFLDKVKDVWIMGGNIRDMDSVSLYLYDPHLTIVVPNRLRIKSNENISLGKGNITKSAEFNFFYDPEAAHIVMESVRTPIVILPWETCIDGKFDTTLQWRLEVLGSVKSKAIELLNNVEKAIFIPKGFANWVVCDAILAAAFLFPERIISQSRKYHVTVELNGTHTRGQLVLDHLRKKDDNVCIIEEIHKDNYKRVLLWTAGLPENLLDWKCLV